LAALFSTATAMNKDWMKANYLIAITLAMIGWLWLFGWIVKRLFL
jgi:hypothetical protein